MKFHSSAYKTAAITLVASALSISALAQGNSSAEGEEGQWRSSEERLQRTISVALQFLAAPHTENIRSALAQSQKDWETYRQSQCRLEATAMAFQSTFDERNVRRCLASEADRRTRYMQNLVP